MQHTAPRPSLRVTPNTLARALTLLLAASAACSRENPAGAPSEPAASAPQTAAAPAGAEPSPTCDIPECFRAVECVAKCGGPVLSSSCCPCPEGQLDQLVECPEPHSPVCDPGCQSVCSEGACNCECPSPESATTTDPAKPPTSF